PTPPVSATWRARSSAGPAGRAMPPPVCPPRCAGCRWGSRTSRTSGRIWTKASAASPVPRAPDHPAAMASGTDAAWSALRQTGQVTLRGEPATWSRVTRWLFVVLGGLVGLLALAPVVVIPLVLLGGAEISLGIVFGVFGVYAMLTGLGVVLVLGYRRQARYLALERQRVILDARGLTLRGVGPIPWHDVGPAEHRLVRNENSDGFVRRAVMPLTASGLA